MLDTPHGHKQFFKDVCMLMEYAGSPEKTVYLLRAYVQNAQSNPVDSVEDLADAYRFLEVKRQEGKTNE
jgi:hypothetical protein